MEAAMGAKILAGTGDWARKVLTTGSSAKRREKSPPRDLSAVPRIFALWRSSTHETQTLAQYLQFTLLILACHAAADGLYPDYCFVGLPARDALITIQETDPMMP